jgi:hypothetical protein
MSICAGVRRTANVAKALAKCIMSHAKDSKVFQVPQELQVLVVQVLLVILEQVQADLLELQDRSA